MKGRKQKHSKSIEPESAEPKARVPFFAKDLDPQSLRSIQAGDDEIDARATELARKLDGSVG